jgi:hypothetical protein
MDSKLLTEDGWKAITFKFKVKDRDLQRALSVYETIDDDEYEDRLKEITNITRLASALKKNKEIAPLPEVVKYLADLLSAAESEQREITKVKALAEKTRAVAEKKAEAVAKEGDDDEDEDTGDYPVRLIAAFQKLKSAKDLSFEFIVCDAKPHCGLMVAKKITPKHKEELTKVTGGSKRFLHVGRCYFEDGRFNFTMEQPVTGLARKLQDSIKNFTSKKLPIKVGAESAEADDEPASGQASAGAAPKAGQPERLAKAPEVWHQTQQAMKTSVDQLKNAVRKEFAEEGPDLVAEIEQNMKRIDEIFETLDQKLADSLAKAHATENPAARAVELQNAKAILADHLNYVNSEKELIAHIDANPFGIKTNLKEVLANCLKQMAQAIG